jgi:hypothetical protein
MAFKLRSLVRIASIPHTDDTAPCNFWKYATADAVATVIADGYFNSARAQLAVNDIIDCACVVAGTGNRVTVIVRTVPASGDITTAIDTDASGA